MLDLADAERIENGLAEAATLLRPLPPKEMGMRALSSQPTSLNALYEALCCPPYHGEKRPLLSEVMQLVQSTKVLRLGDLVPAHTHFLFDEDIHKRQFAMTGWKKLNKLVTPEQFDWVVQESLSDAIKNAENPATQGEVERFWGGVVLIVEKLDNDAITNSLGGLQRNIYLLALQQLAVYNSDPIFTSIVELFSTILERAPQSFWSALTAVSPPAFAEQLFSAPSFQRLLLSHSAPSEDFDCFMWVQPFMQSLTLYQQPDACRTLLVNLLERYQASEIPSQSRLSCQLVGLNALGNVFDRFVRDKDLGTTTTSFIYINNILGLADQFSELITTSATSKSGPGEDSKLADQGLRVVRGALQLESKSLKTEFLLLESGKSVPHGVNDHSQSIWKAVLDSFQINDMRLAKTVLLAINPLIGLEEFREKGQQQVTNPAKAQFNVAFNRVSDVVAYVFQRIGEFSQENLRVLLEASASAFPLFGGLTSAHKETHNTAVVLFKTLSGEDDRSEAIASVLRQSLVSPLNSMAFAADRITQFQTFASVPVVFKTNRDVLDGLCDSQNGALRSKASFTPQEQDALKNWWRTQWALISTSFASVEQWSRFYDNATLTNFCRDAMEYAGALFAQYGVIAATMGDESEKLALRQKVLQQPLEALKSLRGWLRLKDPYLLGLVVNLVSTILKRLSDNGMKVDDETFSGIDLVCASKIKTNLQSHQKAELKQALDELVSDEIEVLETTPVVFLKQGKIDAWSKSSSTTPPATTIRDDMRSLSKTAHEQKSVLDLIRSRQQTKSTPQVIGGKTGEDFKAAREKEKEEKRLRDAAVIARAKALRAPAAVSGEGSAIKGIGVFGKEHAPAIKSDMMFESSDDESEDGDEGSSLIKKGKFASKKKLSHEEERARRMKQAPQGPVKKARIIRSAKDMRARLVPDMTQLHLNILKWDIFHDEDEPPGGIDCVKVSNTFNTPVDYQNTFYPLLISEAWRSLKTARDESKDSRSKPFDVNIVTRMSVDNFYEVSTTTSPADNKEAKIMEGDIIVLSKAIHPLIDNSAPHCLARVYRINRKRDAVEVSYRLNGSAISGPNALSLAPKSKIRGFKIASMTTIEREYASLKSLQYYDLCDEILQAKPSPLLDYPEQAVKEIQRVYGLNYAQAKAILSAKDNDAFTLIQGPPGSGKTKTIVAMVGAILNATATPQGVAIGRPFGNQESKNQSTQKKLLVCAPSNAAVDELVLRLKSGVKNTRGEFRKINVLRLGRTEAVNAAVKDVTLDALVDARIEADNQAGKAVVPERVMLHHTAGRLKEEISVLRGQLEEARAKNDRSIELRLQREFDDKKREQARIGAKIDEDKDSGNTIARDNEINRRRIQQEIINGAHVLCATLSGSGHEMFKNLSVEFETVIIDEAAQSVELSALIPLKYGCSKCILVGDPKQLPPTVLSKVAATFGYEQSLFVRMQQNHPKSVHLLDTQYRMHPEISLFPSRQFYEGRLVDGSGLAQSRYKPWHDTGILGPYRFFDVQGVSKSGGSRSLVNESEIQVAIQLYETLRVQFLKQDIRGKVGIITPYKGQLIELRNALQRRYGPDILEDIDTNTTDAFQGREAEVIIFSCVRANSGSIGFLQDIRRMNVGLTRAKSSLWVLGDSKTLEKGEFWRYLINDAKQRDRYTSGDVLGILRRPLSRVKQNGHGLPTRPQRVSIPDVEMTDYVSDKSAASPPQRSKNEVVIKQEPPSQKADQAKIKREREASPPVARKKMVGIDMVYFRDALLMFIFRLRTLNAPKYLL
jgi:senataxin